MKIRDGMARKRTAVLTIACLVLLAAFLVLPFYGKAEEKNTEIYRKITAEETERLIKEIGLFYSKKKHSSGRIYFTFRIGGYSAGLVLYDCIGDNKKTCTALQMKSYFTVKKEPGDKTLSKVNEWNRKNRLLKSYVGNEGDISLETDLNIRGGVTKETIENFIKGYPFMLDKFVKWFFDK